MAEDFTDYTPADAAYVAICLGREPTGVVGVAARREHGEAIVIVNHPLQRKGQTRQPFPTLYWLIDPALHSRIAEIERKGGVQAIEHALAEDEALLQAHREDNRAYAAARWALLCDADRQAAERLGAAVVLQQSGIGGVANHESVKCLHAQYAYHLAKHDKGSTVGNLMQQRYNL
jgi:hypothetical protein